MENKHVPIFPDKTHGIFTKSWNVCVKGIMYIYISEPATSGRFGFWSFPLRFMSLTIACYLLSITPEYSDRIYLL